MLCQSHCRSPCRDPCRAQLGPRAVNALRMQNLCGQQLEGVSPSGTYSVLQTRCVCALLDDGWEEEWCFPHVVLLCFQPPGVTSSASVDLRVHKNCSGEDEAQVNIFSWDEELQWRDTSECWYPGTSLKSFLGVPCEFSIS